MLLAPQMKVVTGGWLGLKVEVDDSCGTGEERKVNER